LAFEVTDRVRSAHERERLLAEREELHAERAVLLLSEREARAAVERASQAKDEFLAMLGHELRNPLAPIVTALHLLRLSGGDGVARERTIIERQVKHLTALVDDLLDISSITRGKITLKRERIELRILVDRAIEIAGPLIEQRRHELVVQVPRCGLIVDADEVRLAQILSNLLTNAAKYTEPGGHILISAHLSGGEVELHVADNGIGISEQMLPHVFELFMQERQAIDRARGGLGLGLAIVQNLMAMHGGTVSVASKGLGTGSVFTIRMPSAIGVESVTSQMPRIALSVARTEGLYRVLVVDDNIDAGEMLSLVLNELGCETRIAADGPAALLLVDAFKPHLALLDIGLPGMNGYELARRLRQHHGCAGMRLVAVTGYGQKADIEFALQAGFDEHLVKPVEFEQLEALLMRCATERSVLA
jgi:signal transduction histidine kinase/ActR/RegA family two-component response regulator